MSDRKSTRLNSSHVRSSYAVFCLKKKNTPEPAHAAPARLASNDPHGPFDQRNEHGHLTEVQILHFFFHPTAPPALYPLSLHDALPILRASVQWSCGYLRSMAARQSHK